MLWLRYPYSLNVLGLCFRDVRGGGVASRLVLRCGKQVSPEGFTSAMIEVQPFRADFKFPIRQLSQNSQCACPVAVRAWIAYPEDSDFFVSFNSVPNRIASIRFRVVPDRQPVCIYNGIERKCSKRNLQHIRHNPEQFDWGHTVRSKRHALQVSNIFWPQNYFCSVRDNECKRFCWNSLCKTRSKDANWE